MTVLRSAPMNFLSLGPRGMVLAALLLGCSDLASAIGGSCYGQQTIGATRVDLCTESLSLTVDQQATLNAACRSGQLGSVASTWNQGNACQSSGRVGGCRRAVQGIDVVSWVYAAPGVDATAVRAFCGTLGATFQSP